MGDLQPRNLYGQSSTKEASAEERARVPQAMAHFVLKIGKLSRIIRTAMGQPQDQKLRFPIMAPVSLFPVLPLNLLLTTGLKTCAPST